MAMQIHSMEMLIKAINYANPGQIYVCTVDCPLYALQKKCQWVYPDKVGETNIVIMLGMLHLEMATQECGGRLLGGSEWELMFLEAEIYQSGVCNSLLGGKHVKRTRYAYELTLVWLEIMKRHFYEEYLTELGPHEPIDIWEKRLDDNCPTVNFWITVRTFTSSATWGLYEVNVPVIGCSLLTQLMISVDFSLHSIAQCIHVSHQFF